MDFLTSSLRLLLLMVVVTLSGFLPVSSSDLILKPLLPHSSKQPSAVMVLLQAPQVTPSQYLPLADMIQKVTNASLWVAIPEFEQDTVALERMGTVLDRLFGTLHKQGMNLDTPIFYAAHSPQSGSAVVSFVLEDIVPANGTSGFIMLGSFLKRMHRSGDFPVPTLTVGGELDGVCRVSRIMEEYVHHIDMAEDYMAAVRKFPVTVIPGMTHMQFASGKPSDTIEKFDLVSEVADDDAQLQVSLVVASFIEVTLGKDAASSSALSYLKTAVANSGIFFQPLMDAYKLEGSYYFKPPCGENPPSGSCQIGSAWTERAMSAMAGLKDARVNDTDEFHPASEIFPKIHHPKIGNSCPKPDSSCVVRLSSISENIYYKDKEDSGLVPTSACEVRAKLKSRQSVMLAAGYKNVELNVSDAGSRCKKINQLSYDWALEHSSPVALRRFEKFGVPMDMGEDHGSDENGGLWIYLPMSYSQLQNDTTRKDYVEVCSYQLTTDVDYPIGIFRGMHYCKLLSPAKVLEWVYIDGLRAHYSLAKTRPKFMSCGLF